MTVILEKRKRGRPSKKAQAERLQAQVLAARATNETSSQRITRIAERFTIMYRLSQGIIGGTLRSLIVSGAPGVGKSHTIVGLCDSAHDRGIIKNYEYVKGAQVTGIELYKLFYRTREAGSVVLMDDSDSIYDDEISLNLLKAATDTTARRRMSYLSEAHSLKSQDIPPQFDFEGGMIFITNKDFQTIVDLNNSKLAPHMAALISRSHYLDLALHTQDDLIAWINHMITKQGILIQNGLDKDQQAQALKWLNSNYMNVRELSIRTAIRVADYMKTDFNHWEQFCRVMLLRGN